MVSLLVDLCNIAGAVTVLLDNTEVDINGQDEYGETALILASFEGDLETVKVFAEEGGD